MARASIKRTLMDAAYLMSTRSTCSRLHVGCVIAQNTRIMSSGWNGAPAGMDHCPVPHPEGPCENACHAELNAIAAAAMDGRSTSGSWLFCTHQPCLKCSQLIINAGVARVTYDQVYRDPSGVELLRKAGIEVSQLE